MLYSPTPTDYETHSTLLCSAMLDNWPGRAVSAARRALYPRPRFRGQLCRPQPNWRANPVTYSTYLVHCCKTHAAHILERRRTQRLLSNPVLNPVIVLPTEAIPCPKTKLDCCIMHQIPLTTASPSHHSPLDQSISPYLICNLRYIAQHWHQC